MDKYTLTTSLVSKTKTGKITFNNKYDLIKYIHCIVSARLNESEYVKISKTNDTEYLVEAPATNYIL